MPWDRKRLLGYVEIIQFIFRVTDKYTYAQSKCRTQAHYNFNIVFYAPSFEKSGCILDLACLLLSHTLQSISIAWNQYCVMKKWDLFPMNERDFNFSKIDIFSIKYKK